MYPGSRGNGYPGSRGNVYPESWVEDSVSRE